MKASLQERLEALGFEPVIYRGSTCLNYGEVNDIIAGVPISYTRRRYGNQTFCWVHVFTGGEWRQLPTDPWPCVTPKRSEVEREIQLAQATA